MKDDRTNKRKRIEDIINSQKIKTLEKENNHM